MVADMFIQIAIKKCRPFLACNEPRTVNNWFFIGAYRASYSDHKAKTIAIVEACNVEEFMQAMADNAENFKVKKKDFFIAHTPKHWVVTEEQKTLLINKFNLAII